MDESGGEIVLLDCRHALLDPVAGPRAFGQGHLPGAVHAHIDRDLSDPVGPRTGRHPLPDPTRLVESFSRWGIGDRTPVVAYDDQGGLWAARAWWLLRHYGHKAAAVLDGGIAAWTEPGNRLSTSVDSPRRQLFHGAPGHMRVLTAADILAAIRRPGLRLLDARAPERFRGETEPIDPVAGHIPGARNVPAAALVDAKGRFRSRAELRALLRPPSKSAESGEAAAYCGSGVTACHLVLAHEVAGLPTPALYAGSWSEWIRDPARPVERGPPPASS